MIKTNINTEGAIYNDRPELFSIGEYLKEVMDQMDDSKPGGMLIYTTPEYMYNLYKEHGLDARLFDPKLHPIKRFLIKKGKLKKLKQLNNGRSNKRGNIR